MKPPSLSSPQMPDMLLKFLIQKHVELILCNIVMQSKMGEENHIDPKQKAHKCGTEWKSYQNPVVFTRVDCAPEMTNVIMSEISAACVDPEYAKCGIICASDW